MLSVAVSIFSALVMVNGSCICLIINEYGKSNHKEGFLRMSAGLYEVKVIWGLIK